MLFKSRAYHKQVVSQVFFDIQFTKG